MMMKYRTVPGFDKYEINNLGHIKYKNHIIETTTVYGERVSFEVRGRDIPIIIKDGVKSVRLINDEGSVILSIEDLLNAIKCE